MKMIAGVLLGIAVVGGLVHYLYDAMTDQPKFQTAQVTRGNLFVGVTATGTVEPVSIIDVGAQIIGSVKNFGPDPDNASKTIDYGSHVTEGAVLAQLDDLPQHAELDRAVVNLQLSEADLTYAKAKQKQMQRGFKRAVELRNTDSEAEYEKAEAENDMATAEEAMAEAKLEQSKIAKKQAEINLAYTVIRAPVDGVVIDRRVNVGQTVVAGMNAPSLFLLAKDLNRMLVWSAVNEADIGDIQVGQTVTFTVDAYRDRTFSGKVSQIRLNASLQQNIVTYGVIVDVDNTDGKLLPYMTAKLQFEVARLKNVLLVSNQALRWRPTWSEISPAAQKGLKRPEASSDQQDDSDDTSDDAQLKVDPGTPTVWVVAHDGLVRPVAVQAGVSDGIMTEIKGGEIAAGDTIVTNVAGVSQPDFVSSFVSKVTDSSK